VSEHIPPKSSEEGIEAHSRTTWFLRNGNGKPNGHFLRKLKAITKKAGIEEAELHRFRKTCADTLHEEGVSVNTIRIRLGHESLDVTLAHLKGKDAQSEEARNTQTAVAWRCTHKHVA